MFNFWTIINKILQKENSRNNKWNLENFWCIQIKQKIQMEIKKKTDINRKYYIWYIILLKEQKYSLNK